MLKRNMRFPRSPKTTLRSEAVGKKWTKRRESRQGEICGGHMTRSDFGISILGAAASAVGCHALIHDEGDPILVVSSAKTSGVGTHCFNTSTNRWFKAGRWTLPLVGRAERVSELDNLWFGIGGGWPYDLCAMDLYSLRAAGAEAPGLAYSWGDLSLPDDWVMMDCSMVYLGGGKFCVAKIFEFRVGVDRLGMGAVISGLEVVRHGEPSKLVMVKHKSKFYKFTRDEIECIL